MSIDNRWRNVPVTKTPGGMVSVDLDALGPIPSGQAIQFRHSTDGKSAQARHVPADQAGDFGTHSAAYPDAIAHRPEAAIYYDGVITFV